jgi:transposase InsO family protein
LGLARLCGVFGRTRQAYYKQTAQTIRIRFQAEIVLELVCDLRRKMPRLGGRKLYFLLKQDFRRLSYTLGRDAFFSLLRGHGLLVTPRKRFVSTTNSAHHYRTYPNLVQDLRVNRPHQALVADITYIRVEVGFCYLFVVTDVYSRMIVGYNLSPSLGILLRCRHTKISFAFAENLNAHYRGCLCLACHPSRTSLRGDT